MLQPQAGLGRHEAVMSDGAAQLFWLCSLVCGTTYNPLPKYSTQAS